MTTVRKRPWGGLPSEMSKGRVRTEKAWQKPDRLEDAACSTAQWIGRLHTGFAGAWTSFDKSWRVITSF